jgi:hypothetical protein
MPLRLQEDLSIRANICRQDIARTAVCCLLGELAIQVTGCRCPWACPQQSTVWRHCLGFERSQLDIEFPICLQGTMDMTRSQEPYRLKPDSAFKSPPAHAKRIGKPAARKVFAFAGGGGCACRPRGRLPAICWCGAAVAELELPAAATGAGLIAAGRGEAALERLAILRGHVGHHRGWGPALA